MEQKYTARGVLLGILRAILYFGLWFLVQIIVVNFAALVLRGKFPGVNDYDLTVMVEGLSLELNIMVGVLTIIALFILTLIQKDSLTKRVRLKAYPMRFTFTLIIMGITSAYAIMLVLGLLEQAGFFPQSWVEAQSNTYSDVYAASSFMQFLSVGLVAPLAEEFLFRGCILGTLKKEMHPWIAIGISSVLFAVAHGTPIGIIYTLFLGAVMGWLTVTFRSILPSIVFHMAYNCTVAFSSGVSIGIAVISVPILVFQFISIKNYFRGKNE